MNIFEILLTIIAGLIIGSFLNVCIYRLPRERSVIRPRSFCPSCEHTIPWYDNIPVLSFLILRGRCRFCKKKISPRYILVETLTAGLFLLFVSQFGIGAVSSVYIVLGCALLVSTFVDFEYQIIPDEITYPGMALGALLAVAFPVLHGTDNRLFSFLDSIAGLLLGGVLIYAIAAAGTVLFRKKLQELGEESAMGGGDVKYLAMIGAFLGYKAVIFIFLLAPFFGVIVGLIAKFKYKKDIIPYGPYLSIATIVVIVWGKKILNTLFPYM